MSFMPYTLEIAKKLPDLRLIAGDRARITVNTLAKEAQRAIITEITNGEWQIRSRWFEPTNALGIKVDFSTRNQAGGIAVATIRTAAPFLLKHERGGILTAKTNFFVPTREILRGPTGAIVPELLPANLAGKAFVLQTKRGPVLAIRKGNELIPLYGLEKRVRIDKDSKFFEPIERVVTPEHFEQIFLKLTQLAGIELD